MAHPSGAGEVFWFNKGNEGFTLEVHTQKIPQPAVFGSVFRGLLCFISPTVLGARCWMLSSVCTLTVQLPSNILHEVTVC